MSPGIDVAPAAPDDHDAVVALLADGQTRPDRYIAYLSTDADAIAAEVEGLEPQGWDGVLVARRDGAVVGALAVEHDSEPPRVWWHGPAVADDESFAEVAGALLRAGRTALPDHVVEEELAADDRHRDLAQLASAHGFVAEPASAILSRACTPTIDLSPVPGGQIRAFSEEDRSIVAAIHDAAFPASHVPGHRIDEGDERIVLVFEQVGGVVGYAAADREEDGSGDLDLVGVQPDARGQGVGAALVAAMVDALAATGCEVVNLTVRESNTTARRLYDRLSFTEERLARPYRRGFTMR